MNDETISIEDVVTLAPASALEATLDHPVSLRTGDALPPLWHWLYFWPRARQSALGADGHPLKGSFLPDLGLPRRMWAGGRLRFIAPIAIGEAIMRRSAVTSFTEKAGRSGRLGFVTVRHEIAGAKGLLIDEEQHIVYREPPQPGSSAPAPIPARTDATWRRLIEPDETLLFRYSALTFNAHRIHYDRTYVTQVEGYPDLVVHGPLQAALLADLVQRHLPGRAFETFLFRAVRPLFLGQPFSVCGRPAADGSTVELWVSDHEGALTMSAQATLAGASRA
ncbi:maoC like domain protein [Paraburkholderia xenovorans LB400]|uniref:FAS1-like dehydratase domain-containing protein n=1 Tax=Paraburkholderia xenovorans (strain LB400) TaxID=266265 RepID=Q13H85_PARXL|nr:MaoC family dehydratase N-terminal domain-containing protein [Paraburkholderia xenovorans]ABE36554.1 Conserved hypothetical protein [Paraburkholderia xenovorans LB400]AIP34086.1 maoC like domain protein [Paraburkholderia xenovorans LB400]